MSLSAAYQTYKGNDTITYHTNSSLQISTETVEQESLLPQYWLLQYTGYYISSLLFNVVHLAFYIVLLNTPHHKCFTESGTNVTI